MYIYKITNKINNKIYIGQSIKSIEERFRRHIQDAESKRLDTHFARAIRKYGAENFYIEKIDEASSQEELTKKEYYWIKYYDSVNSGYNETEAQYKCGGNTYFGKTEEEMDEIRQKIRESKLGGKNPNSKRVKCKNLETDEEFHFSSMAEMRDFFGESHHQFISQRCQKKIRCLYKGKWAIAYENEDYDEKATKEKNNRKATQIKVKNLETNEELKFPSYAAAERYFNLKVKALSGKAYLKGESFIYQNWLEIQVLN